MITLEVSVLLKLLIWLFVYSDVGSNLKCFLKLFMCPVVTLSSFSGAAFKASFISFSNSKLASNSRLAAEGTAAEGTGEVSLTMTRFSFTTGFFKTTSVLERAPEVDSCAVVVSDFSLETLLLRVPRPFFVLSTVALDFAPSDKISLSFSLETLRLRPRPFVVLCTVALDFAPTNKISSSFLLKTLRPRVPRPFVVVALDLASVDKGSFLTELSSSCLVVEVDSVNLGLLLK